MLSVPPRPPAPTPLALGTQPAAAVLSRMSDAMPWPLLILQRDGGLLHANLAARQLLHRGQSLTLDACQRVNASGAQRQAAFAAALQAARPALLQWPAAPTPSAAPADLSGCTLSFRPLGVADEPSREATMLVSLSERTGRHADLEGFAALHRLSAGETRVLDRLMRGDTPAQAATALGIQAATVRHQLGRVRRKAGFRSTGTLLRALIGLPPLTTLHLVPSLRDSTGE